MSYFFIFSSSDGVTIKQFLSDEKLVAYLDEFFSDVQIKFMDYIPSDFAFTDYYEDLALVIKGNTIQPRPITVIKTYKID